MAFQQSDLDRINAAIASGVQQVTYADGRSVRYQSGADMLAARDAIRGELAGTGNTGRRQRITILRVGRCR
jgi:hypothetical protein